MVRLLDGFNRSYYNDVKLLYSFLLINVNDFVFTGHNTSDHIQQVEPRDQDPLSFQPKFEQVKVKNEKTEPKEPVLNGSSACDFNSRPDCSFDRRSNEEFELDRIALAQFKLLEDWRPDSELQQTETERLDGGPSLGKKNIVFVFVSWDICTLLMILYCVLYFINAS